MIFDLTPAEFGVQVLGALLVLLVLVTLWRAQRSRDSPFDAGQMFQDSNNRTSSAKFLSIIGGVASIWIIVLFAVRDQLEATIFLGWLAIIVLGKTASEWIDRTTPPRPPIDGKNGDNDESKLNSLRG